MAESLGIIAHAAHEKFGDGVSFRVRQIADIAIDQGVVGDLIGTRHGNNMAATERGLGKLLSGHQGSTVTFMTEDGDPERYVITRERRRIDEANPAIYYAFTIVK